MSIQNKSDESGLMTDMGICEDSLESKKGGSAVGAVCSTLVMIWELSSLWTTWWLDNFLGNDMPWIMSSQFKILWAEKKTTKFVFWTNFLWFGFVRFRFIQLNFGVVETKTWLRPWTRDRSLHRWIPSYRHTKLDCEMRPGTIWDLRCGSRRNWHTMMVYWYVMFEISQTYQFKWLFRKHRGYVATCDRFEHRKTQTTKQRKNQQQWTMNLKIQIPALLCRNQLQSSSFRLEISIHSFQFFPIHLWTGMDRAFGRHAPWSSLATWWLAALTSVCWCVPRPVMMLKRTLGPVMFCWIPWCHAWKDWIGKQELRR